MQHRNLTPQEIQNLENQNCQSVNGWDKIWVKDGFQTSHIKNVVFSGQNYLGSFSEIIELPEGYADYSGIYNVHIHNCTIHDNCYIKNIGNAISNYEIKANTIIVNCSSINVVGESTFGNGINVACINEGGGREVCIYDELSVHTAYLMAFYKHKPKFTESLKQNIAAYAISKKSNIGIIGENSRIINCGDILNTNIGDYAELKGIELINNATVKSSKPAPTFLGHGVNIKDTIILDGAQLSDKAFLRHCFVGQGCEIANSYSAENSLFFANSQCLLGEACSIFAGPYTVTHHKSTLLIAGYYSFFNAGSGTNQSNHMYKLGPLHQGVIERGGKTGSDSYILWPGQIGAFTMVLGSHYGNPDISELPFSYLIEDGGKSVLMPAQNIFTVGTTRDIEKWPKRDKRKGDQLLDYIITEALNPYTVNKITDAIKTLNGILEKTPSERKNIMFKNVQLSLTAINRGIKLYEQALVKYVGDELINILKHTNFDTIRNEHIGQPKRWVDLAGLICNTESLDTFISKTENGNTSIENWNSFFQNEFEQYTSLKKQHALSILKQYFSIDIKVCSDQDIKLFLENYLDANEKIKNAIVMDAKKEFNVKSKISFGIDDPLINREEDFIQVRGDWNKNSFILEIQENFNLLKADVDSIINML